MRIFPLSLALLALPAWSYDCPQGKTPTDQTGAAIQEVIDTGFPAILSGTYAISGKLRLRRGTVLCAPNGAILNGQPHMLDGCYYGPADNVQIIGLTLSGGGICLRGANQVVRDVTVRNVPAASNSQAQSGITLVDTPNLLIHSVLVDNVYDAGIIGWNVSGSITRTTTRRSGKGLHLESAGNMTVSENTWVVGRCVEVLGQPRTGLVISGNTCVASKDLGISLAVGDAPVVRDNNIVCSTSCAPAQGIEVSAPGAHVEGNTIDGFEAAISGYKRVGADTLIRGNVLIGSKWLPGPYSTAPGAESVRWTVEGTTCIRTAGKTGPC